MIVSGNVTALNVATIMDVTGGDLRHIISRINFIYLQFREFV